MAFRASTAKESIACMASLSEEEWQVAYPKIEKLVSFHGQKDLLRASSLNNVMRGGAAILNDQRGDANTYALSEEVSEIFAFISHNWIVGRAKKFFCLAMYFNFHAAIVVAMLALGVIVAATGAGYLPTMPATGDGIAGTLLVTPIFIAVVFFGHNIYILVGCCFPSPRLFLDKTCIHQVDKALQAQGISKLGAFIKSSSRMVVLYTDVYLSKLWTVYEVACFLALHPTDRMIVVPTYQPVLTLGGTCIIYFVHLLELLTKNLLGCSDQGDGNYFKKDCSTILIFYAMATFPYGTALRRWSRMKVDIKERMRNFEIEECACFMETDRALVYESITLLMQATGVVEDYATEEEALTAFNKVLREQLPGALTASVGRFGIGYLQVVAIFLCNNFPQGLDTLWRREGLRAQLSLVLYSLTWNFALIPLAVAGLASWCSFCLHLRGWREVVFVGWGCCMMMACSALNFTVMRAIYARCIVPGQGDVYIGGLIAMLIGLTPLAVAAFDFRKMPTWLRCCRRKKPSDDSMVDAASIGSRVTSGSRETSASRMSS